MFKAIVLLAITTKLLAVLYWLVLVISVFVKVCNLVVLLRSIKSAISSAKNRSTVSRQEGRSLT